MIEYLITLLIVYSTMNLIAKFCDPFKPEVQELGSTKSENVMAFFAIFLFPQGPFNMTHR